MAKDLWFAPEEFAARLAAVQAVLEARGLDAILAFEPESITWITGHFTRGYAGYQLAVVPRRGEPTLICRNVSRWYADTTCVYDDVVTWADGEDRDALAARAVRERVGGMRLGIDAGAFPVNAARFLRLRELLAPAELVDVGEDLVRLRLIKSPAEIDYQRWAARAAEAGMDAALRAARPGASERDIAAAACAAMILAGSDTPGPGVLSSGERALHLHGGYGDRVLEAGDTVQYEPTPHVRRYHARFMRTIKVARATAEEHALAEQLIALQDRAWAEVGPGVPASVPDRILREGIVGSGLAERYTNKTFYSLGLLLEPSGGEPLEATPHATWRFRAGMVFHSYLLVRGFGLSETVHVTETGLERLTAYRRALLVAE
jgi:Xaa-Pro dipeptidase